MNSVTFSVLISLCNHYYNLITLMLGKTEGRGRRGRQRTRWLDSITDVMHLSVSTPGDGGGQGRLACRSPWGHKDSDTTE